MVVHRLPYGAADDHNGKLGPLVVPGRSARGMALQWALPSVGRTCHQETSRAEQPNIFNHEPSLGIPPQSSTTEEINTP